MNHLAFVGYTALVVRQSGVICEAHYFAVLFGPKSRFLVAKDGILAAHGLWAPWLCVGIFEWFVPSTDSSNLCGYPYPRLG